MSAAELRQLVRGIPPQQSARPRSTGYSSSWAPLGAGEAVTPSQQPLFSPPTPRVRDAVTPMQQHSHPIVPIGTGRPVTPMQQGPGQMATPMQQGPGQVATPLQQRQVAAPVQQDHQRQIEEIIRSAQADIGGRIRAAYEDGTITQRELVGDRHLTRAADEVLRSVGLRPNLQEGVVASSRVRETYPSPSPTLPAFGSPRHKAIQLSDFIPANSIQENDRLVAGPDGSIKLETAKQRFYEVASWGAVALTSAIQFCDLARNEDPRVVNFDILEYLFYLHKMFLRFKRFTFPQVLQYDRAFRHMQLTQNMDWGTHVPELFEFHLSGHNKPIFVAGSKASRAAAKSSQTPKASSPKASGLCTVFNSGANCPFTNCRFRHQCDHCAQSHPGALCPLKGNHT